MNDELLEAAKPLIQYLAETYNPHVIAIVNGNEIKLFNGIARSGTDEFIRD